MQQANEDEGWEPPLVPNAAAAAANLANGWPAWQQEGELVDENELQQVQIQANDLVLQTMMPNQGTPQSTETISSDVQNFCEHKVQLSD